MIPPRIQFSSELWLQKAGLDWKVVQRSLLTDTLAEVPGFKANIRESDQQLLGIVTDRYSIVQNHEAFAFTDELLGEGVRYETAGSLHHGRKVWLLAKLPENYIISGERMSPYMIVKFKVPMNAAAYFFGRKILILRVDLIDPVLEENFLRGRRDRFVIEAGAIQAQDVRLGRQGKLCAWPVRHRQTLFTCLIHSQIFLIHAS